MKTFSVPLKHPTVCTILPYSLCVSHPDKFYSVNHCLQMPTGNDIDENFFEEPDGTTIIRKSPVLSGKECITSVEQLKGIANDLLSKPIYAEVNVCTQRRKLILSLKRQLRGQYCVVVDTQHMYVRATLKRYLEEAIELMERGVKFCLKFSFASNIRQCLPLYLDPKEANRYGAGCFVSEVTSGCYSKDIEYEVKGFPVKLLVDENTLEFIAPDYAYMELRV
ncbi:hypothetical protein KUTeg_008714 [Tegillarca granosa]|uniref:Uncharacterized protein n=1 Tax=Tegillarca granosa TaxID=220873 RepID=A0ABQ9F9X4_TEGGR|nr:hypothetical protein KUTeg_008714 [Tegillarca granosa]